MGNGVVREHMAERIDFNIILSFDIAKKKKKKKTKTKKLQ